MGRIRGRVGARAEGLRDATRRERDERSESAGLHGTSRAGVDIDSALLFCDGSRPTAPKIQRSGAPRSGGSLTLAEEFSSHALSSRRDRLRALRRRGVGLGLCSPRRRDADLGRVDRALGDAAAPGVQRDAAGARVHGQLAPTAPTDGLSPQVPELPASTDPIDPVVRTCTVAADCMAAALPTNSCGGYRYLGINRASLTAFNNFTSYCRRLYVTCSPLSALYVADDNRTWTNSKLYARVDCCAGRCVTSAPF